YRPHKMMFMSGTSMAYPGVAGSTALLLQANPSLTPNLVKALLEYTAHPLATYNNFEQRAGELNVEDASRAAELVRTDRTSLAPGDPLLTGPAPVQTTTIANQTFQWSGGLVERWNVISGQSLITKYQKIYASGTLLTDGVVVSNGTLISEGT